MRLRNVALALQTEVRQVFNRPLCADVLTWRKEGQRRPGRVGVARNRRALGLWDVAALSSGLARVHRLHDGQAALYSARVVEATPVCEVRRFNQQPRHLRREQELLAA